MSDCEEKTHAPFLTLTLLPALLLALSAPAAGQTICNTREILVAQLKDKFGERRRAMATANGYLIETFVGPDGSWTVLRQQPGSPIACLIAAGRDWTDDPDWTAKPNEKETES